MARKILLTFDVEEFDLPEEYDIVIDKSAQLATSARGLDALLAVLQKHDAAATFFTTAYYAENYPDTLRALVGAGHEIASHLYYHSDYDPSHLRLSRQKLQEITGQEIAGFRSPRLRAMDPALIRSAGYRYDSSLNPTFLPGRYNNLDKPRTWFKDAAHDLIVLPFSVTPRFRIPLFWLAFKNMNARIYHTLCRQTLRHDGYLHLYFHPWEFTDLSTYKIPWYVKRRAGAPLVRRLDRLIGMLKKEGDFITVSAFLGL